MFTVNKEGTRNRNPASEFDGAKIPVGDPDIVGFDGRQHRF
jgi:hypothetical protein